MKLMSYMATLVAMICLMSGSVSAFDVEHPAPGTHAGDPTDGHEGVADPDHTHEAGDHAHGHGDHAHVGDPAHEPEVFEPGDWRTDLSIYTFVVFLVLLGVLTKFAWGPVIAALDAREENIRKNIEDAEAARVSAEAMLADRAKKLESVQDEVREILAEARRDAEHTKTEIVASAQKEADATKHRALEEINRARDQALNDLFQNMTGQVATATEHVIGRALTEDDRNRLIDESLAQLNR